jgi:hypothetical protein
MLNIYDMLAVLYKILDKSLIIMVWVAMFGMSILMWYFVYTFIFAG